MPTNHDSSFSVAINIANTLLKDFLKEPSTGEKLSSLETAKKKAKIIGDVAAEILLAVQNKTGFIHSDNDGGAGGGVGFPEMPEKPSK